MKARTPIRTGPVQPCELCRTPVRTAQYEDGKPRVNEVSAAGRDLPGGHTPDNCRARRNQ